MMKQKLFFVLTGLLVCLFSFAQSPVVFYNQGFVYAKGTGNDKTSIYIDGSFRAVTDKEGSTVNSTSDIIVESSRVVLKGDFINDVSSKTVFSNPSTVANAGVLEFSGAAQQKITYTGAGTTKPNGKKGENWINFPNLEINNSNQVVMDSRLAAKTKNINLAKGWLVLESAVANTTLDGGYAEIKPADQTILAHLNVEGAVTYNWVPTTAADRGFIQVNFAVPADEGDPLEKSLVGFGSPFKEIRADYFMFNTLMAPVNGESTGAGFTRNPSITNPTTVLKAGVGYALAIDVFGADQDRYPIKYAGINFDQRNTNGYRFNRSDFNTVNQYNEEFSTTNEAYVNETLNTEDVTIAIPTSGKPGYYYFSNPYTTPLDVSELLQTTADNAVDATSWGVKVSGSNLCRDHHLFNQVWVLNSSSTAQPASTSGSIVKFKYSYEVASETGGTYVGSLEGNSENLIAPLQMFVVWGTPNLVTKGSFTIPKSQRSMSNTPFLRSSEEKKERKDDFILEFRDMKSKSYDRLSVVVRPKAELDKGSFRNIERIESSVSQEGGLRTSTYDVCNVVQNSSSQVFTKDKKGEAMTVQFFPLEETTSIPVYCVPPAEKQEIQILGLRLGTKDKVETLILEDKRAKKNFDLLPDEIYTTTSYPDDHILYPEGRFVLHLRNQTGIDGDKPESAIYAYQTGDQITVAGLMAEDFGGRLELFDVNGRLINTKTVSDYTEVFMKNHMETGVYLIRLTSDRVQFVKLLVK